MVGGLGYGNSLVRLQIIWFFINAMFGKNIFFAVMLVLPG